MKRHDLFKTLAALPFVAIGVKAAPSDEPLLMPLMRQAQTWAHKPFEETGVWMLFDADLPGAAPIRDGWMELRDA